MPVWYLDYNAEAGYLKLRPNALMVPAGMFDFGVGEDCAVYTWPLVAGSDESTSEGDVYATWSDDCNTIKFDTGSGFASTAVFGVSAGLASAVFGASAAVWLSVSVWRSCP